MSPDAEPSWGGFFEEFHCRECGGDEAYRSRARNFFESYVLPLFLLQPVRCERCFHRCYILRTITVLERRQIDRMRPESQPQSDSKADSRIA
jgi:hypothetical protein